VIGLQRFAVRCSLCFFVRSLLEYLSAITTSGSSGVQTPMFASMPLTGNNHFPATLHAAVGCSLSTAGGACLLEDDGDDDDGYAV
jgi:hypothetical protein